MTATSRDHGDMPARTHATLTDERQRLDSGLEGPMVTLAFVWLALLVAEFVWGSSRLFETLGLAILG